MKSRFTTLDLFCVVGETKSKIVGSRLQNIYDLDSKTFILKFAKPNSPKTLVLIEAGIRIYETWHDRENPNVQPSFFVMKLRKFLRERRVTCFGQQGWDRVVWFEFGHDTKPELAYKLWVELYALGNMILVDGEGKILLILRTVNIKDSAGNSTLQLAQGMNFTSLSDNSTLSSLCKNANLEQSLQSKSTNESVKNALKDLLPCFSPPMLEHCFADSGVAAGTKCSLLSKDQISSLAVAAEKLASLIESQTKFTGVIVKNVNEPEKNYKEFHPICFKHLEQSPASTPIVMHESFSKAADEFYTCIVRQESIKRQEQQEQEIFKKLENVKKEQEARISGLKAEVLSCRRKAQLIEENSDRVQAALLVISTALKNELSWDDLEHVILEEKRLGRPTARFIGKLKLFKNAFDVLLGDDDEPVEICLTDNPSPAYTNSAIYYGLAQAAQVKLDRTKDAFAKAIKSAEAKIRADVRAHKAKVSRQQLAARRKPMWFEKFHWFISSDGYLVIAGREQQQNEILVKRYLRPGDIYVHADMHGAASVVIKNKRIKAYENDGEPSDEKQYPDIPLRTLSEAGNMSLVYSKAWTAKIVTSAWWVYSNQVSKTAPSGEYLGTGSFMIRGRKNFLPPSQLAYSFGILFLLDDEAMERRRLARIEKERELITYGAMSKMGGGHDNVGNKAVENMNVNSANNVYNTEDIDDIASKMEKHLLMIDYEPEAVQSIVSPTSTLKSRDGSRNDLDNTQEVNMFQKEVKDKNTNVSSPVQDANKAPRGKKGKLKKMAKKYGHQDDEERAAKMALLGSVSKKAETKSHPAKLANVQKDTKVNLTKDSKDPSRIKPPNQSKTVELVVEDGIEDEDAEFAEEQDGKDELAIIDALSGSLTIEDLPHLVQAIPVSGPVTSQSRYHLRVKLAPGSQKRGKGAQQAVSFLLRQIGSATFNSEFKIVDEDLTILNELNRRIKELVKGIPEIDLSNAMLSNVRLAASGAEASKGKKKGNQKKNKINH